MARLSKVPTAIQQRVLEHIQHTIEETGRPPTELEIAGHFHWKSRFAVYRHIRALIRKGFLQKTPNMARGLNIPGMTARHGKTREIPLVGSVPAGLPIDAVENLEGNIGVDTTLFPELDVFALKVKGESMTGANISDGDIAIVHKTPNADDGNLVVALIDGEATLKRLVRKNGNLVLHAENPMFKDIVIKPGEDFALAGVVVGIIRRTK
jgi:repressor LexA